MLNCTAAVDAPVICTMSTGMHCYNYVWWLVLAIPFLAMLYELLLLFYILPVSTCVCLCVCMYWIVC